MNFYPSKFVKGMELLSQLETQLAVGMSKIPSPLFYDEVARIVTELGDQLDDLGMQEQQWRAYELAGYVQEHKECPDIKFLTDLKLLIHYELKKYVFVLLDPATAPLYESPLNGFDGVEDAFPSSVEDIENAGKCLSLGLYSACVFHLMGPIQDVLEALSVDISTAPMDYAKDTWNVLLVNIHNALDGKRANPQSQWKADEQFYIEMESDIKAVKIAWRNPTMHFRRPFNKGQALKVHERVKELMVLASTKLKSI